MTFPVTYEETGNDSGKALIPLPEGGYILFGTTTNPSTNTKNIFLASIEDNNLNPVWSKSFGDNINHVAACIKSTPDGKFIIKGTQELSSANHAIFLLKTDSDGNQLFFMITLIKTKAGGEL